MSIISPKMTRLTLMICILQQLGRALCKNSSSNNSLDPNKDMYVIHAMVYQVGILTNGTDDKATNATMGNQEALTFYHTNGSNLDVSGIPPPLLTNVTAESIVQVAPKPAVSNDTPQISWSDLKGLASLPKTFTENGELKIAKRDVLDKFTPGLIGEIDYYDVPKTGVNKRSATSDSFRRDMSDDKTTVKVVKGGAVIPQGAGVQSIAIPPLLSLNNNLSNIPVPIPNTSVVHYAKINTVVRKP